VNEKPCPVVRAGRGVEIGRQADNQNNIVINGRSLSHLARTAQPTIRRRHPLYAPRPLELVDPYLLDSLAMGVSP